MPAPTTADDFLDLVRKSNLVDPARLQAYLALFKADDVLPIDPPRLAARFVKDGILTNFQAQQLLRGRYRNFTIVGKFKILEPLGAGGMSKVFLVEHIAMGHRVAMKILPIEGTKDDPALIARFQREAKAVASLNHPNVIRAHDIGSEGTRFYYIIMDYVAGVNLHDLVRKRGPLDPATAAHYVRQTAVGLQHIHDAGLIHRDIKPGNLLVDRNGVVKILDLGLARFETEPESLTKKFDDNAILGTADYLAPEQALRSASLDSRADLYGLGATFYFLLAGQAPFEAEKNVTQKLLGHQMKQPAPLGKFRGDIPPVLVAAVERMMAKNPEERYATAADVAAVLAPWADADVPPPAEDELPRRSPASLSQWGSPSRPPRGSKPPSTARRSAAAMAETPPTASKGASAGSAPPLDWVRPVEEPRSLAGWAVGGVAAALTFAALGIGLWLWAHWDTAAVAPPVDVPPRQSDVPQDDVKPAPTPLRSTGTELPPDALLVTAASKPNAFRTLADAVAAAKDGATIAVQAPIAEHLALGPKAPKNLTLLAASAAVTWRAPAGADPTRPLLRADACDGLTVTGFTFDGGDALDTLVEIGGACPGLTLDDLTLTGGRRILLRFSGPGGAPGRLTRVMQCRLAAPSEARAAIAFESPQPAAFVEIVESRIEGRFQSGVLFAGPADGVAVRQTRFFAVAHGLRYEPIRSKAPLRAVIAGNTFCRTARAIGFRELPPATGSHLTVQNNLFLDVERLASVDDLRLVPADLGGRWIWAGDDMRSDSPAVAAKRPRYFRKTFELSRVPLGPVTLDISCDESFAAWVNGEKVSGAVPEYYNQRVYSYDVTKAMRLGKNVLAVQAENRGDPLDASVGTPAGLFMNLTDRSASVPRLMASSDGTWRVGNVGHEGWEKGDFDDAKWPNVKAWGQPQAPWSRVTWDAEVNRRLAAVNSAPISMALGGNVRNHASWEAYPVLDAMRSLVEDARLPPILRDPGDAQFLLYAPAHALFRAGLDKKPVGVPGKPMGKGG